MVISRNSRLVVSLLVALFLIILSFMVMPTHKLRNDSGQMYAARNLALKWLTIVDQEKQNRGILSDLESNLPLRNLLGSEFTPVTTTLGSPEAKELSINPDFAALVVRFLHEAGIDSSKRVGVTISGSFPALSISTLAALQTLHVDAVVFSSLGASSYGANQTGALWIDYERWLMKSGGLKYRSSVVTYGGENDNGSAIYPEGLAMMDSSLEDFKDLLFIPTSLEASVASKAKIFNSNKIDLLINIGGNQASLGGCSHSRRIPPGLNYHLPHCEHSNRGLILELNAQGIPVIHLLNIRELAIEYGIQTTYGEDPETSSILYTEFQINKAYIIISLLLISMSAWWIKLAKE